MKTRLVTESSLTSFVNTLYMKYGLLYCAGAVPSSGQYM